MYSSMKWSGVECDECGMRPIVGPRYNCRQCRDFDLCEDCKDTGVHSHHRLTCIVNYSNGQSRTVDNTRTPAAVVPTPRPVQQLPVHQGIECDECGLNPIVGIRYKCLQCADFDLCEDCKDTGVHSIHSMSSITSRSTFPKTTNPTPSPLAAKSNSTGRGAVHHGITCDGCFIEPIVGVRFKCNQCYDYDLCEDCKHDGIHSVPYHAMTRITEPPSKTDQQTSATNTSKVTPLITRIRQLGFENEGKGVLQRASEGLHDVTAALSDSIERLMNNSVLDKKDLGRGRDADGITFSKFKVTKVRQIFMEKNIYNLYLHHLKNIESEKPPKLGFEIDCSAVWLNKILKRPRANEVFLFHGTKPESSEIIAQSGFDERVAGLGGMFGAGIYFAENADKSDQYTQQSSRQMFLARVILGNPYKTSKPSKYRRPPPLDTAKPSKLYDSVIALSARKGAVGGALQRHQEFIVYDRYRCLPVFLIDYRRV